MNSKLSKGDRAVENILEAAEILFLTKGFNGTSMRDIAKAAGYRSVAGIYNHFSDKEAIFDTLLRARHPYDEILDTVQTTEGETVAELIPAVFLKLTALIAQNSEFFRLVLIDFLEFNTAHIQGILNDFQEQMVALSSRLFALDDLETNLEPLVVIRVMAIQVFGYAMTNNVLPEVILELLSEEEWRNKIADILVRGLSKEKN